jgi:alkylation response protein AidB-like acyl-CoA dehydrogenase
MDLSYGEEYEQFRAEVREFLRESWPPKGDEAGLDRAEQMLRFRLRATSRGFLCRNIPKRYGGSEQPPDVLRAQILRDEFAAAHAPGEVRGIGPSMLVPTLLERGEEWQKEKWVRDTVTGKVVWCQGYSEPGSGSDLASLTTRGELEGSEWVINGQKIWTSGADSADFMFCLTRTEPDSAKHAGISYLLIDMHQPGIEVRPLKQMTGGSTFNEVFLTDARTPKDWIVGKRGEGWIVSRTTLKHERNSIGNAANTTAAFEALLRLARKSVVDGVPALAHPAIRQRIAALEGYVLSHQYSGYRQLTRDARGQSSGIITMMNKLIGNDIGDLQARISLDLLGDDALLMAGERAEPGGRGPRNTRSWVTSYMSSLGGSIAGGTRNIQRNVIGERGLGLPRDAAANQSSGRDAKRQGR